MSAAIGLRWVATVLGSLLVMAFASSPAQAAFGIAAFDGETVDAAGGAYTQAGGHPFAATTKIEFNRATDSEGETIPDESVRNIEVELPPGFVGNPQATPTLCTEAELTGGPPISIGTCPLSSQVGVTEIEVPENFLAATTVPVYNMVPAAGEPARLGIRSETTDIHISPSLRSDGDYGVTATLDNVSNAIPLLGSSLTMWGVPADPRHNTERGNCLNSPDPEDECGTDAAPAAFWTLPTACTPPEVGLESRLRAESWLGSSDYASSFSHLPPIGPDPGSQQGPTGCDLVSFDPTFQVRTTTSSADSPSGLEVDLKVPQPGVSSPTGLATSALRAATVTLPAEISVNASSSGGLSACSPAQIGLLGNAFPQPNPIRFSRQPAACPDGSKLGSVRVDTPVLKDPLLGSVYLAQQGSNPFGSLLAIYLVAEGHGVVVKLPGRISTDPQSGEVTATFENNPQLPFEHLQVQFFSGARAALTTPERCGTYAVTAAFTPWSGRPPVERISKFPIDRGPGGGACPSGSFDPRLDAGTSNPLAGQFSPFLLAVRREDGTPRLGSLQVTFPKGLLGKLAGVDYCPDSTLSAVRLTAGSGSAELASPSCPANSQIGTVSAGAGSGASPFYVSTGRAYLAGPYKGAPLSLAVVVPALAGPFDLGNVLVRTALRVDPETTRITALSDPLPTILQGIPLDLRDLRVQLDRRGFTLNPSNCEKKKVTADIASTTGNVAHVSNPFQVGGCAGLAFKPNLKINLKGGAKRGRFPALTATLTYPKGGSYANLAKARVTLPHSEFLEQGHIGTVCTDPQFAADACPQASIYGFAEAVTPLLDQPLKGPVYLRTPGHRLPDLVADLNGQIHVTLRGKVDTGKSKGIRTTFEMLPDGPVSRFTLSMRGGKKGLLVNSENICQKPQRAVVNLTAQNGETSNTTPLVTSGCRGKGKKKR